MDLKTMTCPSEIAGIEREISVQTFLEHKNVAKLYDSFVEKNHVYMVMEWALNGNLYAYLYKKK